MLEHRLNLYQFDEIPLQSCYEKSRFINDDGHLIRIGDVVAVNTRQSEGQTGIVSAVHENHLELLSLDTFETLRLTLQDISSIFIEKSQEFKWGDLVRFIENNVIAFGIVTLVRKGIIEILKPNNQRTCKSTVEVKRIQRKSIDKLVQIKKGIFTGKKGLLKHLHQEFAFVYLGANSTSGGFFACKNNRLKNWSNKLLNFNCRKTDIQRGFKLGQNVMFVSGPNTGCIGAIKQIISENNIVVRLLVIGREVLSSTSEIIDVCANFKTF